MFGWLFAQDYVTIFNPNSIFMVFNTSLGFALGGAALLVPNRYTRAKQAVFIAVGLFTVFFACIICLQDITGLDFGIDQFFVPIDIKDLNPHPGRLAPQTSICFALCGVALLLLLCLKKRWANIVIQALLLLVMALGMIGLAGAWIRLELLFSWYKYSRMAVPTSAGFVLFGAALWFKWYHDAHSDYLRSDERRIAVTGIALIVGVAFTVGMSVFGSLVNETTHTLEASLVETHTNQSRLVENEIGVAIEGALPITTRLLMNKYLPVFDKNPADPTANTIISQDAQSFLSHNFTAVAIYSADGMHTIEVGHFIEAPELSMQLHQEKYPAELLWDQDGAHLRVHMDIVQDGKKIGSAVVERGLAGVGALLLKANSMGKSAETGICIAADDSKMNCLPLLHRPQVVIGSPRRTADNIFPMDYALKGETGILVARDYRDHQVVAAYGLIGDTGLGMVVKIDTDEFYAPIKRKLEYTLCLMIALSWIAILIQRAQLVPLVKKLVRSEHDARLSNQQLRVSEEQFRSAMESASIGMALVSPKGKWLKVNKALCDILGYSEAEMLNLDFQSITHPEDLEKSLQCTKQLINREIQNYQLEKRYFHKKGHTVWVLIGISLAWDIHQMPKYFIAQIQDISERKTMERMKNEFISTVSHELRTPLTSIRGSLGLIVSGKMGALPDKIAGLMQIAYNNSERLVRIINDILDIEKIESGQFSIRVKQVEVAPLLQQAVDANSSYGEKYRVRFVIKEMPEKALVVVDPDRFLQVMNNLLSNAAKFSHEKGEVWVSARARQGRVHFSVQDFGDGIPEAFHKKIFTKFAQADTSDTRRHEGTGLGLNITKQLVEAMRGHIRFDTAPQKGTTFFVDFPMALQPDIALPAPAPSAVSSLPLLLICEDDSNIAHLLQLLLMQAGFTSEIAFSLAETRQKLAQKRFAALTLDLALPDGNGLEFIREIREQNETRNLPVIIISAQANNDALEGEAIGVVDWLSKPFDEKRLIQAVQRAVFDGRMPKILHVEDDLDLSHFIAQALSEKAQLVTAITLAEAEALLKEQEFDLLMLDVALPDGSGLDLLERLPVLAKKPVPVLILSATEIDKNALGHKVESIMVKSRMSETRLIETIIASLPHAPKDT